MLNLKYVYITVALCLYFCHLSIYEGESNENLKYFLSRNLLTTKVHIDFIFLCSLHCGPFYSLLHSNFPSQLLHLLQWPLMSLLGVPDQVEKSLLQN